MATIRLSALAPGISKFSRAIMSGDDAFDAGREQGAALQGRIAQSIASARAHDAAAALNTAKTDDVRLQLDRQQPAAIQNNEMLRAGIPTDESDSVTAFFKSGKLGGKYATPTDGMGPVAPSPSWAGPGAPVPEFGKPAGNVPGWEDKLSPLARRIATTHQALTLGQNIDSVAKAEGELQDQDIRNKVLAGTTDPITAALAQMASKGTSPYHFAEAGVGNNYTGKIDDSGPVAQRFAGFRNSATDENIAQGESALAAAGAHRAAAGASGALAGLRGVQADNARIAGGMDVLDLEAATRGQPLPSSNRVSRGSDSTNAKLDNQIYATMMKDPAWANAPDHEFTAELVRRRNLTPAATARPGAAAPPAAAPRRQPDMKAAQDVKAEFKAGRLTKEQAKAKLQQLGFE